MWLLPYARLTIDTPVSREQIQERLAKVVDSRPNPVGYYSGGRKPYRGRLERDCFKIGRRIWYRNSFRPVIIGRVNEGVRGRHVDISMRMNMGVTVFMVFWLSAMAAGAVTTQRLLAVGIAVAGYVVMMLGFSLEALESRRFLRELLEPHADPLHRNDR
jgi:hypothetical protein